MGDNGVVLFVSKHLDTEYCFFEDYMTVNGTPLRYSEMVDINEVTGDSPAFEFTYGGRRFTLPYDSRYREQITPYFVRAALLEPQIVVDPEPATQEPMVEEPEEPAPQEPVIEEPVEPIVEEPEEPAPQEPVIEEPAEPAVEEPMIEEPEKPAPQEPVIEEPVEPAVEEPVIETSGEPDASPDKKAGSFLGGLGGKSKMILIVAAAVAVAIVIGIIAIAAMGGKPVDGLDGKVKIDTIENDSGDELYIAKIDDDAEVEDYALDFYEKCVTNKDEIFWVMNKKQGTTIVFVPQNDAVLVIEFSSVEGEDEDPSLIGKGDVLNTWIMYPDKNQIIKV